MAASHSKNVDVPTWFRLTLSDTVNEIRGCRGFEVWTAGTVKWRDIEDFVQTQTFDGPFPVRVTGQIARVYATGTTLDPTQQSTVCDIVGLR